MAESRQATPSSGQRCFSPSTRLINGSCEPIISSQVSVQDRSAEGHRFLEHTTDAYIEAWGPTLERAFAQAAEAFYETMLNVQKIAPTLEEDIQVDGHDKKELVYNWIEQLLLEFDIKAMVYASYHLTFAHHDT